jgi:hypothetical protein
VYLGAEMQPGEPSHAADAAKTIALTPEQMQARVGVYVNVKDADDLVHWVVKDGKLETGNIGEDVTYAVAPISESQFRLGDEEHVDVDFLPVPGGAPKRFTLKQPDGKIDTYTEAPSFAPTPGQLAEYAGVYSSREIDPLYEVKVEAGPDGKDRLVLHHLKSSPDTLHPVIRDFFTVDAGKMRFTRDGKGAISGFLLTTGRVIDLRFERGRPAVPAR